MARAIRCDWRMSQDQRDHIVARLMEAVDTDRWEVVVRAAQTLISADNVNAKRESTDTQADAAEGRLLQAQLQAVLADPVLVERLLGGPPPQVSPPPDDTSEPVNGKPHS